MNCGIIAVLMGIIWSIMHGYHTVKNLGSQKLWGISTVGSLAKKLGELMSICIGNVMEIVKIGKRTWQIAVICQIRLTTKIFDCAVTFLSTAQMHNR